MEEGKREKCKTCINYDEAGHCIAKEEFDFFDCSNDEFYEPVEE